MPDNPELIETAETELDRLISIMHNSGLNYWEILKLFVMKSETLLMMSQAEYCQKGGQ